MRVKHIIFSIFPSHRWFNNIPSALLTVLSPTIVFVPTFYRTKFYEFFSQFFPAIFTRVIASRGRRKAGKSWKQELFSPQPRCNEKQKKGTDNWKLFLSFPPKKSTRSLHDMCENEMRTFCTQRCFVTKQKRPSSNMAAHGYIFQFSAVSKVSR